VGRRAAIVAVGACIPLLLGRETVGQLETVTEEAAAEPAKIAA
jgi:hypothetical protein